MIFDNSSVMVLINEGNTIAVRLLELDNDTQTVICESFSNSISTLVSDRQIIPFDGSYKPNDDELLSICNFVIPDLITDAIRNPLALQSLIYGKDSEPDIRAVFVGERTETGMSESFAIAFQRFRKEQYLSTRNFNVCIMGLNPSASSRNL